MRVLEKGVAPREQGVRSGQMLLCLSSWNAWYGQGFTQGLHYKMQEDGMLISNNGEKHYGNGMTVQFAVEDEVLTKEMMREMV